MDNKKDASELSAAVPGVPYTTPPPEEQITTEQMRNLSCSPNPAKESAALSFSLNKAQTVSIAIVDVLGRTIARPLEKEQLPAGEHTVNIDFRTLPSGTYHCRLVTEYGQTQTITIIHHD